MFSENMAPLLRDPLLTLQKPQCCGEFVEGGEGQVVNALIILLTLAFLCLLR